MTVRALRWSLLGVLTTLVLADGRAWGLGGILGQSKAELKLRYDVTVSDPANGQVAVEFALADEGRLAPLDAVELMIPRADGSGSYDLTAPLALRAADGRRVVRFNLRTDWAARAEVWLTTHSLDGKTVVGVTRCHHRIRVADAMQRPAPASAPAARRAGG